MVIYRHWKKKDRIEISSQSPVLVQVFPIELTKTSKSRFSPENAIFSYWEPSHWVYCMHNRVIFHGKPLSCSWRGVQVMYLHDPIIGPHVPRYDYRTWHFPPVRLSNFMTKNVLQWCHIVSTLRECSGKCFPRKCLALRGSTPEWHFSQCIKKIGNQHEIRSQTACFSGASDDFHFSRQLRPWYSSGLPRC